MVSRVRLLAYWMNRLTISPPIIETVFWPIRSSYWQQATAYMRLTHPWGFEWTSDALALTQRMALCLLEQIICSQCSNLMRMTCQPYQTASDCLQRYWTALLSSSMLRKLCVTILFLAKKRYNYSNGQRWMQNAKIGWIYTSHLPILVHVNKNHYVLMDVDVKGKVDHVRLETVIALGQKTGSV